MADDASTGSHYEPYQGSAPEGRRQSADARRHSVQSAHSMQSLHSHEDVPQGKERRHSVTSQQESEKGKKKESEKEKKIDPNANPIKTRKSIRQRNSVRFSMSASGREAPGRGSLKRGSLQSDAAEAADALAWEERMQQLQSLNNVQQAATKRASVVVDLMKRNSVGAAVVSGASKLKRTSMMASGAMKEAGRDMFRDPGGHNAMVTIITSGERTLDKNLEEVMAALEADPDVPPPPKGWLERRQMKEHMENVIEVSGIPKPETGHQKMEHQGPMASVADYGKKKVQVLDVDEPVFEQVREKVDPLTMMQQKIDAEEEKLKFKFGMSMLHSSSSEDSEIYAIARGVKEDPDFYNDIMRCPIRKALNSKKPEYIDDHVDLQDEAGKDMSAAALSVLAKTEMKSTPVTDGVDFYGLGDHKWQQQLMKELHAERMALAARGNRTQPHEYALEFGNSCIRLPRNINGETGGQALQLVTKQNPEGGGEIIIQTSAPSRRSYRPECPDFSVYKPQAPKMTKQHGMTGPTILTGAKDKKGRFIQNTNDDSSEEENWGAASGGRFLTGQAHMRCARLPPNMLKWEDEAERNKHKKLLLQEFFNRGKKKGGQDERRGSWVGEDQLAEMEEQMAQAGNVESTLEQMAEDIENQSPDPDSPTMAKSPSISARRPSLAPGTEGDPRSPTAGSAPNAYALLCKAANKDSLAPDSSDNGTRPSVAPAPAASNKWAAARNWRLRGRGSWDQAIVPEKSEVERILDKLGLKKPAQKEEEEKNESDEEEDQEEEEEEAEDNKSRFCIRGLQGELNLEIEFDAQSQESEEEDFGGIGPGGMDAARFWGALINKQPPRPQTLCPELRLHRAKRICITEDNRCKPCLLCTDESKAGIKHIVETAKRMSTDAGISPITLRP